MHPDRVRLLVPQAQTGAADLELQGIPERGAPHYADRCTLDEAQVRESCAQGDPVDHPADAGALTRLESGEWATARVLATRVYPRALVMPGRVWDRWGCGVH
jgi:hypothetical protein